MCGRGHPVYTLSIEIMSRRARITGSVCWNRFSRLVLASLKALAAPQNVYRHTRGCRGSASFTLVCLARSFAPRGHACCAASGPVSSSKCAGGGEGDACSKVLRTRLMRIMIRKLCRDLRLIAAPLRPVLSCCLHKRGWCEKEWRRELC